MLGEAFHRRVCGQLPVFCVCVLTQSCVSVYSRLVCQCQYCVKSASEIKILGRIVHKHSYILVFCLKSALKIKILCRIFDKRSYILVFCLKSASKIKNLGRIFDKHSYILVFCFPCPFAVNGEVKINICYRLGICTCHNFCPNFEYR